MSARLFSDATEIGIAAAYEAGRTMRALAKEHATNATSIHNVLRRRGLVCRSAGEAKRKVFNHSAFANDTDQAIYWGGFLLADGCVQRRVGRIPVVSVALALKDEQHIAAFARFCDFRGTIEKTDKYARVQISSAQIVSDLRRFGVVPNKTGVEVAPVALATNHHFWRGVIDGDGWITKSAKGYPVLGICGSLSICASFISYANTITKTTASPVKIKGRNCWTVSLHGSPAVAALRVLYGGKGDIALARKATAAHAVTTLAQEAS